MNFNLNTFDWVAISSITSCLVVIITGITLWLNKRQLNEIKHQWVEENRARLNFSIVSNEGRFLLKIANIGKNNAFDIKLHFNEEFISTLFSKYSKNVYQTIQSKSFVIESGEKKYYDISPSYGYEGSSYSYPGNKENFTGKEINDWLDTNLYLKIEINGSYCDKYKISESFSIGDFITKSIIVKDDISLALQEIQKGTIVQNDQYMPIQKSLDIIARHVASITNDNK